MTFDQGYSLPAAASIFSLLKNHPGQAFKIYLVLSETNPPWILPIMEMVRKMGSEVFLKTVNLEIFSKLKFNLQFTPATYFRIMAAELFQESKVLYLDSDTVVHASLMEIWNIQLGDFPLAAVSDPLIRDFERLDLLPEQGYFNSGFMLLNLDKWRAMDLGNRVLNYIRNNHSKIEFADQCGLNAVLQGNWKRLAPKWNVQAAFYEKDSLSSCRMLFDEEEIKEAKSNPKVIHFTSIPKPWNLGCYHPFRHLFWNYLSQTPFKRTLPLNFSIPNLIRSLFPLHLKKYYWRYLKRKQNQLAVS